MRNYLIKMGTGIMDTLTGQMRQKLSNDTKRDYLLLSCHQTSSVIRRLLNENHNIICNLSDRNGPIQEYISTIEGTTVKTAKGNLFTMTDNFLYDILYDKPHKNFKLCEHDEYFEEIPV